MKNFEKLICLMIAAAVLFAVSACGIVGNKNAGQNVSSVDISAQASDSSGGQGGGSGQTGKTTVNLMDGITAADVTAVDADETFTAAYNQFATGLFKQLHTGENLLISPLSIEIALAMTSNGAKNKTLSEMETVLFSGASRDVFNAYYKSYINNFVGNEKVKINLANSIWINAYRDDVDVKQAFLQANADYYGAAAYKAPFNGDTLSDLNGWVKNETNGLIDKILDRLLPDEIMYLINATSFDAEWAVKFEAENTFNGTFTTDTGDAKDMKMMPGIVRKYLENDFATGFIKDYYGGRYSFVAMLPNKGVALAEAVSKLDAATIKTFIGVVKEYTTHIRVPKFKVEYEEDIIPALAALGMNDLFSPDDCDLTGLAKSPVGNVYVDLVKHKTMIDVDEAGTKAAAVTIVGVRDGAAGYDPDAKYVYLDRPFIYFIMDNETDTPLFMGTFEK